MFTRQDYMSNKCSHEEYYGQFVNQEVQNYVLRFFGKETLLDSRDKNLNDIPLYKWDSTPLVSAVKFSDVGDSYSLAGKVCILKEAARQVIKSLRSEK